MKFDRSYDGIVKAQLFYPDLIQLNSLYLPKITIQLSISVEQIDNISKFILIIKDSNNQPTMLSTIYNETLDVYIINKQWSIVSNSWRNSATSDYLRIIEIS
jgi:hypothetical protein